MVAGYVDKIVLEPWSQSDWDLFPNAVKVQVVKKASSNFGHVLDVEPGDATPAQAPGWVKMRRAAGLATPTIYCNLSTWPSVQNEFNIQGVAQPLYWIAKYDDVKNFPSLNGITAIAKQYHGNDPNNYDLSWVADVWPGVDGDVNMAIAPEDLTAIADAVWNKLIFNNRLGRDEWAKTIIGANEDRVIRQVLQPMQQVLVKAITDSDANDVTAQQVADAVKASISADVVQAIDQTLANVTVDATLSAEDKTAIAAELAANLSNRLLN